MVRVRETTILQLLTMLLAHMLVQYKNIKIKFKSDGQQFHQYQSSELHFSPLIIKQEKDDHIMLMEIQVSAWDRDKNVMGLNRFLTIFTSRKVVNGHIGDYIC